MDVCAQHGPNVTHNRICNISGYLKTFLHLNKYQATWSVNGCGTLGTSIWKRCTFCFSRTDSAIIACHIQSNNPYDFPPNAAIEDVASLLTNMLNDYACSPSILQAQTKAYLKQKMCEERVAHNHIESISWASFTRFGTKANIFSNI